MTKPVVFNYGEYTKAIEEIKRLEAVNKELENIIIESRIRIDDLETENIELKKQLQLNKEETTVTDIIAFIKQSMCKTCVNEEECTKRLESGEWYPCPLDLL